MTTDQVTGVVRDSQPNVFFDLLPPTLKNPSFVVRFDLEIPRPRFVIAHRTIISSYSQLTLDDRRELLRAAMDFSKKMDLHACSLSVPMGTMCPNSGDKRFFAFLNVPSHQSFLEIYRSLEKEIPRWDDPSWRTPNWPQVQHLNETVSESYQRGIQQFCATGVTSPEVSLAPSGVQIPKVSRRGSSINTGFVIGYECSITDELQLHLHSHLPLVGLSYIGDNEEMRVESRWELLDGMHDLLLDYVNLSHRGCYMSVSLSDSFIFNHLPNIIGMIRFTDAIPISLLALVRSQHNRALSTPSLAIARQEDVGLLKPVESLTRLVVSAEDLRDACDKDNSIDHSKLHSSTTDLSRPPGSTRKQRNSKSASKIANSKDGEKKRKRKWSSCQGGVM